MRIIEKLGHQVHYNTKIEREKTENCDSIQNFSKIKNKDKGVWEIASLFSQDAAPEY